MKKNAFTIICALLTLALSILLGALFGSEPEADQASGAESHRAVASNHD